jgi:tetratricopeptide (TPR) repeat protein
MKSRAPFLSLLFFSLGLMAAFAAQPARAGTIHLPREAVDAMDKIYSGNPDAAIPIGQAFEHSQPDHPLGYLLEAEADWWKIYCSACEIKFGMVDAWRYPKQPDDDAYFALGDAVIRLAHAQIAKSDSAEMHVYAGLGYGLKTRLYALRGDSHNVARAGVASRTEMIRALQLDPEMADATAALGMYNYYVDTLSGAVKILRFLMGIPGGSKEEGIRQLQLGADQGVLMKVDARFYLAKNLRTFDLRYQQALDVATPLIDRYPRNPTYQLLVGNLDAELGRKEKAAEYWNEALQSHDSPCAAHLHDLADAFLATLR